MYLFQLKEAQGQMQTEKQTNERTKAVLSSLLVTYLQKSVLTETIALITNNYSHLVLVYLTSERPPHKDLWGLDNSEILQVIV